MELAMRNKFSDIDLKRINNCHIFLQVFSLADISNDSRTTSIVEVGKHPITTASRQKIGHTKIQWPFQPAARNLGNTSVV